MTEYTLVRTKALVEEALAHATPTIALIKLVRQAYSDGQKQATPASDIRMAYTDYSLARLQYKLEVMEERVKALEYSVFPPK